jgi:hypothetical protein
MTAQGCGAGRRRRLVRTSVAALVVGVLGLGTAWPAAAHTSSANYRTAVTSVSPAVLGLRVAASPDGSWLKVTNRSAEPVIVLGYEHEPYLKVTREGVWQNTLSPATYLNRELTIGDIPSDVDPKASPRWKRVSHTATARFHDHRIHWMGNGRPSVVDRDPGKPQLVKRWDVQLIAGSAPVVARGTLRWQPSPSNVRYLVFGSLAVAFIAMAGGLLMTRRRRMDRAEQPTEHEPLARV